MCILFFRCHTSADMPLCLIHIQYFTNLCCQHRIDPDQTFRYILMYGRLANAKLLSSLSYSRIRINDIGANLYGTFFNIFFQVETPITCCYILCKEYTLYAKVSFRPILPLSRCRPHIAVSMRKREPLLPAAEEISYLLPKVSKHPAYPYPPR